jgi:hypothetical protein
MAKIMKLEIWGDNERTGTNDAGDRKGLEARWYENGEGGGT